MGRLAGRLIDIGEVENHELLDDPLERAYAPGYEQIPAGVSLVNKSRPFPLIPETFRSRGPLPQSQSSRVSAVDHAGTAESNSDEFRAVDVAFASSHSAEEVTRMSRIKLPCRPSAR